jgi:hypothetical protein
MSEILKSESTTSPLICKSLQFLIFIFRGTPPSKGEELLLQKEERIENLLYIITLRSLRKISVPSAVIGFWLFDRLFHELKQ